MGQRSVSDRLGAIRERPESKRAANKRVPLYEQKSKTGVEYKDPMDRKRFRDRWVNERDQFGDRTIRFRTAGYEFVPKEKILFCGAESVTNTDTGLSFMRKQVGIDPIGQPLYAVLMWIKMEWFDEDFEAKMAKIDEVEGQIKRTLQSDDGEFYGDVNMTTRLHQGKRKI